MKQLLSLNQDNAGSRGVFPWEFYYNYHNITPKFDNNAVSDLQEFLEYYFYNLRSKDNE